MLCLARGVSLEMEGEVVGARKCPVAELALEGPCSGVLAEVPRQLV